jgi:dehydration protein DpgD
MSFGVTAPLMSTPDGDVRRLSSWHWPVTRPKAQLSVRAIKESVLASVDLPLEEAFSSQYTWEERPQHSRTHRSVCDSVEPKPSVEDEVSTPSRIRTDN